MEYYVWLGFGETQGDAIADGNSNALQQEMTPAQLAEGQRRLESLRGKQRD